MKKNTFLYREWIFVFFISGCLLTFSGISWVSSFFLSKEDFCQKVEVVVQGAVKNPGSWQVYPGTSLQKIIKKARPLPGADISCLPEQVGVDGMEIEIFLSKEISVFVSGALENPGEFILPYGSFGKDLLEKLQLYPGVKITPSFAKKKLQSGQRIVVPFSRK